MNTEDGIPSPLPAGSDATNAMGATFISGGFLDQAMVLDLKSIFAERVARIYIAVKQFLVSRLLNQRR